MRAVCLDVEGDVMQNLRMSAVVCGLEGAYDGGGVWRMWKG